MDDALPAENLQIGPWNKSTHCCHYLLSLPLTPRLHPESQLCLHSLLGQMDINLKQGTIKKVASNPKVLLFLKEFYLLLFLLENQVAYDKFIKWL
jgi:hypothetical protein